MAVMNTQLKSAWFAVVVIAVTLLLFLVVGVLFGFRHTFGTLGLLGLLGLTPFLFRKKKGKTDCDERDLAVAKKAALVSGVCSYLAVVLGAMSVWFVQILRGEELISVHLLPILVAVAAIVLYFAHSAFIIYQYTPKALGSDE